MAKLIIFLKIFFILIITFECADVVWKKCDKVFCKNVRETKGNVANYILSVDKLKITNKNVEGTLTKYLSQELTFQLTPLKSSTFRLVIDAKVGKRSKDLKVLLPPEGVDFTLKTYQDRAEVVTSEDAKAIIYGNPLKIEFYNNDTLVSIVNEKNRLVFDVRQDSPSVALDVSFPGAIRAYGLPEHAERLSLRNTTTVIDSTTDPATKDEPYRHFNVDYAKYKIESTEALYGAIGVLYAHGLSHSSGVFWYNTAQTWVDVEVSLNQVDAYFMSEAGAIDLFVLTGPTIATAVQQYTKLTGVAPLPQYFSLGYHQSRYSYMSQAEVVEVVDEFDKANLPVDVVWLDIDYTEKIKYFTWNQKTFKTPKTLQTELLNRHRELVAIIDPHISRERDYFLHEKATESHYYVREFDDSTNQEIDYIGKCWPDGDSSYLDFLNPEAFDYYASLYNTIDTFDRVNLHIWNDMNEPSVFDNDDNENTMAPNLIHYDGTNKIKHRDIHNIYGLYQIMATHEGMLGRTVLERPFILTRSHFAGAQRYAAIWTGDNVAKWEYLKISFPMCLTEALAGISFCGADVGGFMGIPSEELYQRWYQAGAWLPFYRGHTEKEQPRREPYLFPQHVQERIKLALNQRYAHIPEWYKAFREHELTGEPVIRPVIYQYPTEGDALDIDDQVLIGQNILAAPVLKAKISTRTVYLPGGHSQNWFNIDEDFKMYSGSGFIVLPVTLDSVPVFYRGGSIIVRKDIPRLTTWDTKKDPYTLYICLNNDEVAEGTLYEDDHRSFDYKTDKGHIYISLTFENNTLTSKNLGEGTYKDGADITKLVILNPPQNITGVRMEENKDIAMEYLENNRILTISNLTLQLATPFEVKLTSFSTVLRFNFILLCFVIIKAILM